MVSTDGTLDSTLKLLFWRCATMTKSCYMGYESCAVMSVNIESDVCG